MDDTHVNEILGDSASDICPCVEETTSTDSILTPHCICPRDDHGIVIHEETCLMYKNEMMLYHPLDPDTCLCGVPPYDAEPGVCPCCKCVIDRCMCRKSGREALDEWRKRSIAGVFPSVMDSAHPLMQKFQENLKQFLEKENARAEEEILDLRDEFRLSKEAYNNNLECIYHNDHDTNNQRILIEEYEAIAGNNKAERVAAEKRAKETNDRYKKTKVRLEQDIVNEKEINEELEALTMLCQQLDQWRDDTESDLTVTHRMSDRMRAEKRTLGEEKRQLDMILFALGTEVWRLESKLKLFQKQMQIKGTDMEKFKDKVTAYGAELEDLDLDKRRLMALWNAVLINIQQRDKVFTSVNEDYKLFQENYRMLIINLNKTKRISEEEMNKGKELAMKKDKILYDTNIITKLFKTEAAKRVALEAKIVQLTESLEMADKDQELMEAENYGLMNVLTSTGNDYDRKMELKIKLENDVLTNLQDCLLNDKAVEAIANGINKMRELSRKQEISLVAIENNQAKMTLEIEVYRNRQACKLQRVQESQAELEAREKEFREMELELEKKTVYTLRKQRDLDLIQKKYVDLKMIYDSKSPQERRVDSLEHQIKLLRQRTEELQRDWLRLQGLIVNVTKQYNKTAESVNLIHKQIQICDQRTMAIQAEAESVRSERARVERTLRDMHGRLEMLERTRKDVAERNENAHRANLAFTHEYTANLKGAEMDIICLEDDIDSMDKEKTNLTLDLDRLQREALIWQRKGIQAVELKKNMATAKSAVGEIGKMKADIHRMTVQRELLRKTAEKLSEDVACSVTRREILIVKARASAALEKARGSSKSTSQSQYRHKLRLAKGDVARVSGYISDTKAQLEEMFGDQVRLEKEIEVTSELNSQLEEQLARLIREHVEAERQKLWLLERIVRGQRVGSELKVAVKKKTIKVKKAKTTVIAEYAQCRKLNETLHTIVDNLRKEYPNLEDKLAIVKNTLSIYQPEDFPRLSNEECLCPVEKVSTVTSETIDCAEKPFER